MEPFHIQYIEYGKVFTEHDATDFQILDHSSNDVLKEAGKIRCEKFIEWGLKFPTPPSKTPFSQKIPNISACMVWLDNYYLFVQIQRREEGELARSVGNTPRLNRPFNQVRFVYIEGENIKLLNKYIINGRSIFSSLLYNRNQNGLGHHANCLKDYKSQGVIDDTFAITVPKIEISTWSEKTGFVANKIETALDFNKLTFQTKLQDKNLDWTERLKIIDELQVLLWPITGIFTFALDYISDRDDISLKYYGESSVNISDSKEVSENSSFLDTLIEFREKYKSKFESDIFINKFRKYFSNHCKLMDAGEIAYALTFMQFSSNKVNSYDLMKRNILVIQKLGDFSELEKICRWDANQQIEFLVDCYLELQKEYLF